VFRAYRGTVEAQQAAALESELDGVGCQVDPLGERGACGAELSMNDCDRFRLGEALVVLGPSHASRGLTRPPALLPGSESR
jgi:hypothetical protein